MKMNKHQAEKRRRNKSRKNGHSTLDRKLRRKDVCKYTGLSVTTLWRLEKAGKFPARIRLSSNAVGWSERAVIAWLESRQPADDAA
jgi:prophage regulatory protein